MAAGSTRKALVVEDAAVVQELVTSLLRQDGFEVSSAADGERGIEMARAIEPDLVVLDLTLPGVDGIEVCRQLRTFSDAYVVMLTAKADEVDKLIGLGVGADDYITKPFSGRELMARVQVLFRRARAAASDGAAERRFGELVIDTGAREVRVGGAVVELTRIEYDLLDQLSASPRTAFSRRQLLEEVWGSDFYGDDHVVNVHVSNLRQKIEPDPSAPRYVLTVRGVGYRMGDA